MKNTSNKQAEIDLQNKDVMNNELSTKSVKGVIEEKDTKRTTTTKRELEINFQKAAANAIVKRKQDLAAKEIEQRLKREIEKQRRNEIVSAARAEPDTSKNLKIKDNCNTLKMETGKLFGITKIGERIMSIITVGGHEATMNPSGPNEQILMHIDVYADYFCTVSPKTPLRAIRALLTRGGGKLGRIDSRYIEVYGPHEVMLKIDGNNIYTETTITCDEDLVGQIYTGRENLKVRSNGHYAMLQEDVMHLGTKADVSAHVININRKKRRRH